MNRLSGLTLVTIALLCLTVALPPSGLLAQQQKLEESAKTNLAIDLPEVVAEVKEAYDRYNQAVNSNNVAVLDATFRNDARTIRYGQAENLYGYKQIEAFRGANRPPAGPPRTLSKTVITTYGRDFAVASTLTHRASTPGKVGRQMQTWVRFPEGWRVVAAHVSTIDEPPADRPQ
jgi:AtzH-like